MTFENLEYIREDSLAIIRLNRPDCLNALNQALISELKSAIQEVADDSSITGLLITGNGRGFCAGADITTTDFDKSAESRLAQGEATYHSMIQYFNPIIQMIYELDKPTLAAVNGVAAGYGVSLALACDLVYGAESASFIQVFVPQLGIIPDGGSTWLLPRLVTGARVRGMILTGKKITARKAKDWGMIWECLPDDELYKAAHQVIHQLANGPAMGIRSAKYALKQADGNSLDKQLQLEAHLQKSCCGSEDFAEGCLAFAEKRKPNFVGK